MRRATRLIVDLHRLANQAGAGGTGDIGDILAIAAGTLGADAAVLLRPADEDGALSVVRAHPAAPLAPIRVPGDLGTDGGAGEWDRLGDHLARSLSLPDIRWSRDADSGLILALGYAGDAEPAPAPADDPFLQDVLQAVLLTCRTVEERTRLTRALEGSRLAVADADRTKADFLALMGHELRTPLNAVIGFSELIASQAFGPLGSARYVDYAGTVLKSGMDLLAIIDTVLDFAQGSDRIGTPEDTAVDLYAVVSTACKLVQVRADRSQVLVDAAIPEALPAIRGDRRMLGQVVVHLLSNAIAATTPEGRVTVTIRRAEDGGLVLSVADTGIGMTPAAIADALRPADRTDIFMARRFKGAGLGLPLVREIAELHQGRLAITSRPGDGTTVTVALPPERLIDRSAATAP